jgi:hypothetical protein
MPAATTPRGREKTKPIAGSSCPAGRAVQGSLDSPEFLRAGFSRLLYDVEHPGSGAIQHQVIGLAGTVVVKRNDPVTGDPQVIIANALPGLSPSLRR